MPNKSTHKSKSSDSSTAVEDLSHSMVHYLLAIHKLKENRGFARVTDIAKELNLTKGSVSTALNNLKKRGLVEEEEECKFVILTELGHDEVHKILSSRTLLFYFLRDFVGVSEESAQRDSCLMEHLLGQETVEKFFQFMKDLTCTCERMEKEGRPLKFQFKTALDLCQYDNASDFMTEQKGDGPLD